MAELHKVRGNSLYAQGKYEEAIQEYTKAIIKSPSTAIYYTNRALTYMKLKKWDSVIDDCEKAMELDPNSVKGYYYYGQALIEKDQRHNEAISLLKKAYELSIEQRTKSAHEIARNILIARKKRWDYTENRRQRQESDLLVYLKGLINQDRDREKRRCEADGLLDEEMDSTIDYEFDEKVSQLEQLSAQSDENLKKREVPDYLVDKISFNVFQDPVITPSGITYERTELMEHLNRIGHFDPLSRLPISEKDIVPNLALREAAEEFLQKNGWAADY